jgi:hypothetical protein
MTELVLQTLYTEGPKTPAQLEAIAREKASDFAGRNVGGFYNIVLENAGLIDYVGRQGVENYEFTYVLSDYGREVMAGRPQAKLVLTPIGIIHVEDDGQDCYMKVVSCNNVPLDRQAVRRELEEHYCYRARHPGADFCGSVTVMIDPYRACEAVAVIHRRFDI